MRKMAGGSVGWKKRSVIVGIALAATLMVLAVTGGSAEASSSLSIEAERMSGGGKVFSDKTASNRKARAFYKNQAAQRQVSGSLNSITVRAKGDSCNGAPRMAVEVDGKRVLSRFVKVRGRWANYSVKVRVPSGRHTITTKFTNDRRTRKCDRNLRIDKTSFTLASSTAENPRIAYGPPVVIREGGTYSGKWSSQDPDVPAVSVVTNEPVVIQDSTISGRGNLIEASGPSNVTVRDSRGYGLNPNVPGRFPGRFFKAEGFANVVLENNYLEGTSGIYLYNYSGGGEPGRGIRVVGNSARNIDGRYSNGAGGFSQSGFHRVQFVQLNAVVGASRTEIAWNQVINEPGKSRVEDNINVHHSRGTQESPIQIHDNYVQGAYPARPSVDSYSGGGIITDGSTCDPARATGFVKIFNNQVVSTSNYGIAVYSGHDNEISGNRVVSSGYLADGSYISAQNVGIYVADMAGDRACGTWHDNHAFGNAAGWVNKKPSYSYSDYRNDFWFPVDGGDRSRNTSLPGQITRQTEAEEFSRWRTKASSAGALIGPAS